MDKPNRGHADPHMTTRTLIRTAIPHDTAKVLARSLGVTHRQGRRIAAGKVPGRLRVALVELLDRAIARNQAALERANAELRAIAMQEMLVRAQARRDEVAAEYPNALPRLFDGSEDA